MKAQGVILRSQIPLHVTAGVKNNTEVKTKAD